LKFIHTPIFFYVEDNKIKKIWSLFLPFYIIWWFNLLLIWSDKGDIGTYGWFGWFMVLNATFNYISVISWRSVLLVEETRIPGENHGPVASHWQTLSHNVVSSTPRLSFDLTTLVVIGTDCSCSLNPTTIRSRPRRTL
jgi:hypothetical protein